MRSTMDADEIITQITSIADAMRAYALEGGGDLNAASLFAHAILMRMLLAEPSAEPFAAPFDCDAP